MTHPDQGGQGDQLGLSPQHFEHRRALDALFFDEAVNGRSLEDAETDIEPDPNHDDAEPERHAPSPGEELIARDPAEQQHLRLARKRPTGPPHCGHEVIKPRCAFVFERLYCRRDEPQRSRNCLSSLGVGVETSDRGLRLCPNRCDASGFVDQGCFSAPRTNRAIRPRGAIPIAMAVIPASAARPGSSQRGR